MPTLGEDGLTLALAFGRYVEAFLCCATHESCLDSEGSGLHSKGLLELRLRALEHKNLLRQVYANKRK